MKPSMLVIDHVFHTRTRSFDFLFKLLAVEFELIIHYVDPYQPFSIQSDLLDHEYILICQLDFITPFFIARGKKVVVVPMYDGSAGLPDLHWVYNHQASYINFSLEMHIRALKIGCRSILVQYFPSPMNIDTVSDFSTRRVFFWERLPKSNINAERVASLIGSEIDSIHVHQSSDDRNKSSDTASLFQSRVTTSSWFEDRSDFETALDACNIFIAPRSAEGIGHAFLEAMAKGMIVIANDLPTHNEYIGNWQNGILFDAATQKIDLGRWDHFAPAMGQMARASIATGHTNWLAQATKLVDYVRQTPRSSVPDHPFLHRFAREAMADYQEGFESYCAKLKDNPFAVQVAGHWPTMDLQVNEPFNSIRRFNDKGLNYIFGQSLHDSCLRSGWSEPESGHVWAVETTSSVAVTGTSLIGQDLRLIVEVRALESKKLKVTFDSQVVGNATIGRSLTYYAFNELVRLGASKLATLVFEVEELDVAEPDPRRFAFMLQSIRLVSDAFVIDNDRLVVVPSVNQIDENDSEWTHP